ncbi:hypothetical protein D3C76_1441550 [compost metagenome]
MIGPGVCRVVPVIRSNYQQVIFAHFSKKFWQSCIKFLQRTSIALWVAPMSIQRIEINQICKQEPRKVFI